MTLVPVVFLPSILFFSCVFYFLALWLAITMINDHKNNAQNGERGFFINPVIHGAQREHELCPICKNGMTCESLIFHASKWNTDTKGGAQ